jgi:transcriptional regulator with XRE-family HTH domain
MLQVGQNIRTIRELRNFTQDHMASQLNMSVSNYSNIENGKTDLTLTRLEQIAGILHIDYKQILSLNPAQILNVGNYSRIRNTYIINNDMRDELVKQLQIKDEQINRLLAIVGKLDSGNKL